MNKRAFRLPLFIAALFLVGSCGAPPKPPEVDESRKRPANTAMAVDLQTCRSDLQNTRILAAETTRRADSASASAQQLAARQQALAALQMRATVRQANSVFTVRFGVGSTRLAIPAEMSAALVEEARSAPLVMIRGRTDGHAESPAESQVARARATAVRDYLVGAGVDAAHIRTIYQSVGDHAADNTGAAGRAMNRRVEIEVYRAAPVVVGVAAAATSSATPALP